MLSRIFFFFLKGGHEEPDPWRLHREWLPELHTGHPRDPVAFSGSQLANRGKKRKSLRSLPASNV